MNGSIMIVYFTNFSVHINNKKKYKSSKHSKHKSDELGHHSNSEPSLSSTESFHHDSSVGSGGSPEIPVIISPYLNILFIIFPFSIPGNYLPFSES